MEAVVGLQKPLLSLLTAVRLFKGALSFTYAIHLIVINRES